MGWYESKHEYIRGYCIESDTTCAETHSNWIYRRALIKWYIEKLAELSDEDLENVVIHEFTHVVLAPVTQDQPEEWHEQVEYVTQTVTVILQNLANNTSARMSHEQS